MIIYSLSVILQVRSWSLHGVIRTQSLWLLNFVTAKLAKLATKAWFDTNFKSNNK